MIFINIEDGLNYNSVQVNHYFNDNKVTQHSIIDDPDYSENMIEQNLLKRFNNAIELSNIKNSFSFFEKGASEKQEKSVGLHRSANMNNLTFEENFKTPVKKSNFHKTDKASSGGYLKSEGNNNENSVYTVYDLEFIKNLLDVENDYSPNPEYIKIQIHMKVDYRAVLVDWLMELCEEFAFKRDTFHYTVNYIDRYFSCKKDIEKKHFQLIGVVALSLASKFEVRITTVFKLPTSPTTSSAFFSTFI